MERQTVLRKGIISTPGKQRRDCVSLPSDDRVMPGFIEVQQNAIVGRGKEPLFSERFRYALQDVSYYLEFSVTPILELWTLLF
ncbi:hypothetical protein J6590_063888 [Homalodisca vitripennis]|nr:hypothetical protein J6590_063888 [Homalodisca vitripennis]